MAFCCRQALLALAVVALHAQRVEVSHVHSRRGGLAVGQPLVDSRSNEAAPNAAKVVSGIVGP